MKIIKDFLGDCKELYRRKRLEDEIQEEWDALNKKKTEGGVKRIHMDCYDIRGKYNVSDDELVAWLKSGLATARCQIRTDEKGNREEYPSRIYLARAAFASTIRTFDSDYTWFTVSDRFDPPIGGRMPRITYIYDCKYIGEIPPEPEDGPLEMDEIGITLKS